MASIKPIILNLPAPLAQIYGVARIELEAGKIGESLAKVNSKFAGLPDKIFNELGEPRRHVLIFIGDTEIRELDGIRTELRGGETIHVVAAASGG